MLQSEYQELYTAYANNGGMTMGGQLLDSIAPFVEFCVNACTPKAAGAISGTDTITKSLDVMLQESLLEKVRLANELTRQKIQYNSQNGLRTTIGTVFVS